MTLWKTKTFWAGIGTIVTGAGMICYGDVATGIQTIFLGIVSICGRDAILRIQTPVK